MCTFPESQKERLDNLFIRYNKLCEEYGSIGTIKFRNACHKCSLFKLESKILEDIKTDKKVNLTVTFSRKGRPIKVLAF